MFRAPVFNLLCNIYRAQGGGPAPPSGAALADVPCQLRFPRPPLEQRGTSVGSAVIMTLILPSRTDIRPGSPPHTNPDAVEVPAGTGRFYSVLAVEDSARGFPNETRRAFIYWPSNFPGWMPIPMP